ncbi:MAG: hypothetical protein ACO1N6_00960 [Microcella sp.]
MTAARTFAALPLVAVLALAGCSGSPTDPLGLGGCLEGDRGTIAVGVSNTSGDPIVIEGVELSGSSGVEIVDRFLALDDEARSTAVLFDDGGRAAFDGVDLDQQAIDPDAAAYVGVEVQRTGSEPGRVGGLTITVDGSPQAVPVTLDLLDACG